ncbi:hypothetical protein C8Q79DRAFT_602449 [Trametes meyenii]|nr:hypothetical protein C8Q79DRAFT_602449 [Trametes meyenii]
MVLTMEMLHARAHAGMYPTYAAAAADMEAHAAADERFTVPTMATSARMSLQCPVYVDLPDPDAVTFEFADLPPPLPLTAASVRAPTSRPNPAQVRVSKPVNVPSQSAPVAPQPDTPATSTPEHDTPSTFAPEHKAGASSTSSRPKQDIPSKPLARFTNILRRSLLSPRRIRSARAQACVR